LSVTSEDEALFEMLGVDKLCLDAEKVEDEPDEHHTPAFFLLTPPRHCLRPNTPHAALLMETSPLLLSLSQCSYIIYNLGYRATNNGGMTHGPNYVKAAAHFENTTVVELMQPNHHKVCVFTSDLVLKWIQNAFIQSGMDDHLQQTYNGVQHNYRINPRLRLLRYDARDDDVFLPHYDATTTCAGYESQLTILLYLNTGGGVHFGGGNTLFLNAMQPCDDNVEIVPELGKFVVFNHELYHASQALRLDNDLVCDSVRGGTKFVLRSDIMFPVVAAAAAAAAGTAWSLPTTTEEEEDLSSSSSSSSSPFLPQPPTTTATVQDILGDFNDDKLVEVLQQLDMDILPSVTTLMVPGAAAVETMLVDLGLDAIIAKEFVRRCQEAVS
jgi:hypothetical protein